MLRAIALCLLLLPTSACASMVDTSRIPQDWPKLQVLIREVSDGEVLTRCFKYVSPLGKVLLSVPMACAEVSFLTKTCVIYITKDAAPEVLEHEMDHCRGGDHPGESTLRDAWSLYKARP